MAERDRKITNISYLFVFKLTFQLCYLLFHEHRLFEILKYYCYNRERERARYREKIKH